MVTMMIPSDNLYNINFENHYIIIDFSWFIHTFCVSVIWSWSSSSASAYHLSFLRYGAGYICELRIISGGSATILWCLVCL